MIKEEIRDNKRYVTEFGKEGDIISEQIFYNESDRVDCTIFPKGIEFKGESGVFGAVFDIKDYEFVGNQELPGIGVVPVYRKKE